jgi:glycosyltransferase involved in cell wall biosynthesis
MNEANSLSVVIPVYNEEENLAELTAQVLAAVRRLSRPFEILFIDDGSTDQSLALIRQLAQAHPEVRYLAFEANAGQSAAFAEGFQEARGAFVVTLDADLQNDPADIPALFAKQAEGFDMVIGWRAKRKDTWIKRYGSKIANAVRSRLTRDGVRDTGCSLKLMRADLARRLPRFKGMHRFLPALMRLEGATIAEIKVNHRPRTRGVSKYGTWDRLKAGVYDLFGVRWLIARAIRPRVKERN